MRGDKHVEQLKTAEPGIALPEEAWNEIESAIGLKEPNPSFRRRVAHYAELALTPRGPPLFGTIDGPHVSKVRNQLRKLNADAKRLAGTLLKLQEEVGSGSADADWTLYMTLRHWGSLLDKDYPVLWRAIETIDLYPDFPDELKREFRSRLSLSRLPHEAQKFVISAVSHLVTASEAAMQALGKGESGKPRDPDFDELICTIAILFREETGTTPSVTWDEVNKRYSGRFFDFSQACCRAFAPRYAAKSNKALGKAAQRALKKLPINSGNGQNRPP